MSDTPLGLEGCVGMPIDKDREFGWGDAFLYYLHKVISKAQIRQGVQDKTPTNHVKDHG